jgi:hypothetical protein
MGLFDKFKGSSPVVDNYDQLNKPIHDAMDAVKRQDNPQTRMSFYKALLDGKFLLLEENIKIPNSILSSLRPREREIRNDEEWGMALQEWEDKEILPVFTSEKSIKLYPCRSSQYWVLDARTVFKVVLQTPADKIFVNAFRNDQKETYHFWVLNRDEINALAQGLIPNPSGVPTRLSDQMQFECPAKPFPSEWTNALTALLKNFSEVKKATLLQASFYTDVQEEKKPFPCLLLLKEKNTNTQKVADEVGPVFEKVSGGKSICVTSTPDVDEFNETAKAVKPFYIKK